MYAGDCGSVCVCVWMYVCLRVHMPNYCRAGIKLNRFSLNKIMRNMYKSV